MEYIVRRCISLFVVFVFLALQSCGELVIDSASKAEKTIREMSIEESIAFYKNSRGKYPIYDSIFIETIMSVMPDMSIDDKLYVVKNLKGTKAEDYARLAYEDDKNDYLAEVQNNLSSIKVTQQQLFLDEVLPMIEMGLDSIINSEVEYVMDKYAGGFLNYNKLAFFFGRDAKDFNKLWNDTVKSWHYSNYINDYIVTYVREVRTFNNKYYEEQLHIEYGFYEKKPSDFRPIDKLRLKLSVGLTPEMVSDINRYSNNEKSEMFTSGIKDYVIPGVLASVSLGTLAAVYEVGNLAYDVNEMVNNEQPSADVIISDLCAYSIIERIKDECIDRIVLHVNALIEEEARYTYEKIRKQYEI